MPITFDVTGVEPDRAPLEETSLSACLEARGLRGVVAADAGDVRLVDVLPLNGMVMAMHVAYTRHRPLTLTPDAVWLCIAQALARHVETNAEALRPRLVRHQGKLNLETRRDDLAIDPGSIATWSLAVEDLAAKVREHLGGRADLFVSDFTTTNTRSRVASQITLLSAMQSYFEYAVFTGCGIPRITLEGTPDDWRKIRERVRVFADLDLGLWAEKLDPVLAEFEATSKGKPSRDFWERAYKLHDASGGEKISGWVNVFFPYMGDSGTKKNPWFVPRDNAKWQELPKLDDFPSGLCVAPFTWRLLGADQAMQLVAGFVGVERTQDDGVAPAIGWCVAPAMPERRFRAFVLPEGFVHVSPRDIDSIKSLEGLAEQLAADGHHDVDLSLSFCSALESLDGIAAIDAVDSLSLLGCDRLERLEPLATAKIRSLLIESCPRVTDLRPLASMPCLRELALHFNPQLTDYRPLAALQGLEKLELLGDCVPEPILGWHEGADAISAVRRFLLG